jgi:hypothetical protein
MTRRRSERQRIRNELAAQSYAAKRSALVTTIHADPPPPVPPDPATLVTLARLHAPTTGPPAGTTLDDSSLRSAPAIAPAPDSDDQSNFTWTNVSAGDPHSAPTTTSPSMAGSITSGALSGTRDPVPAGGAQSRGFSELASDGSSSHNSSNTSTATSDSHQAQDPDTPLIFGSNAFAQVLRHLNALTTESQLHWKIQEDQHSSTQQRFQTLDETILDLTKVTSSTVAQVTTLYEDVATSSRTAHEAQDSVQTVADLATTTRSSLLTLTTDLTARIDRIDDRITTDLTARIDRIDDRITATFRAHMPGTSSPPSGDIDAAFAVTEAALHSGLRGFEDEVHSRLDRTLRGRTGLHNPSSTNTTPRRNPLFPNVDPARFDTGSGSQDAHASPPFTTPSSDSMDNDGHDDYDGGDGGGGDDVDAGDFSRRRRSPKFRLALTRDLSEDILLWHTGDPSDGDPLYGTSFMEAEDVVALGVDDIMALPIAEDHFNLVENWENARWVQQDRFFADMRTPYSPPSNSGPNVTDILKQISTWDKLSDLTPCGWQDFYNKLRRSTPRWKISMMPFEAINLKYECKGHGLCVCGLGLVRWKRMGDVLFHVLEYLLPTSNPSIYTTMTSLANGKSSANGYELLWILLKEFIPAFDPTRPAPFPTWPSSGDIFQFGRLVLMYCDLSRHRGTPYTEAMKSRMFLTNVKGRYAILAQQFTALVNTYCPGRDGITRCKGPLPFHLTLMELARSFYDATMMEADTAVDNTPPITSIHAFHTDGSHCRMSGPSSSLPSAVHTNASDPSTVTSYTTPGSTLYTTPGSLAAPPAASNTRPLHVQGFAAHALRTSSRQPAPRRTPPNPTDRQPIQQYEGPCDACGKYGHPAARCDMLAMAIFLQRYSKNRLNQDTLRAAEDRWVQRNKRFLPRDDRTPRTVLANYCAELQFPEEQVDAELDWDYLGDSTFTDEDEDS